MTPTIKILVLLFVLLSPTYGSANSAQQCTVTDKPADNKRFPAFPQLGASDYFKASTDAEPDRSIPHDVDRELFSSLLRENCHEEIDQLYDIFSWQSFLAVNWPTNDNGDLLPNFTDSGVPNWLTWTERHEVFRGNNWQDAEVARISQECQNSGRAAFLPTKGPFARFLPGSFSFGDDNPELTDKQQRFLVSLSATLDFTMSKTGPVSGPPVLQPAFQQSSGKILWDQNGQPVHYETLLNARAVCDIMEAGLYNKSKQREFYNSLHLSGTTVQMTELFQRGNYKTQTSPGAVMLKLAWKIIGKDKGDNENCFYTRDAYMPEATTASSSQATDQLRKKKVGLVGMHILHKTFTARRWVWSTFEHVDNLGGECHSKPLFHRLNCEPNACPENTEPPVVRDAPQRGTQVVRKLSLPSQRTQTLNRQVRNMLGGTDWRHYQLVGTQYFLEGVNLSKPSKLTNPVLETYVQNSSCLGCHTGATLACDNAAPGCKEGKGPGDFVFLMQRAD